MNEALERAELASGGRFTKLLHRLARGAHRRRARAARAFGDGGARDDGVAARPRAGRRGDHAVVHVRRRRRTRSCCAAPRPCSSTCGRTRSTSTRRWSRTRSRRGRRRSSPSTTRAFRARWTRSARSRARHGAVGGRGRRPGAPLDVQGTARRRARATRRRSASTRRRTSICGEGGALLVRRPEWLERSLTSCATRERTGSGSSAARSTSTLGRPRLLVRPRRAERGVPVGAARARRGRARRSGGASGTRTTSGSPPLEERGLLRRPIVPDHVEHNAHLYYILVATSTSGRA